MVHRVLRRAGSREPRIQEELACERGRGRKQLVPVQHPPQVLGVVAVDIRALNDHKGRRSERDRHPRDIEVALGGRREPPKQRAPVLGVLDRRARDDEKNSQTVSPTRRYNA